MPSSVVVVTAIVSLLGALINLTVMSLILLRRSKRYHILFSALLTIAAVWDLGIFLSMIRNDFPQEVVQYVNAISILFSLFPAVVFHFTTTYLNQPHTKSTIVIYGYCLMGFMTNLVGVTRTYNGVYSYEWGSMARWNPTYGPIGNIAGAGPYLMNLWTILYFFTLLFSCWLLYWARKVEKDALNRRHMGYILSSFLVFSLAYVKVSLSFGYDLPYLLPLGILLVDSFGAIIGLAILKDRLFDITVYVRKGVFYSLFTAVIVFVFDFSQHLIATSLGGFVGEESSLAHYGSIAIVIVVFMPLKQRLELAIEGLFAEKRIEF